MAGYVVVELTYEEWRAARDEAERRHNFDRAMNYKGRNGGPTKGKEAFRACYLGTLGEMVAASYLGLKEYLYLDKVPKRGSCDLPGIDVKTRSRHNARLIIQGDEHPDKIYLAVSIENSESRIHGWIRGEDGMKDYFWDDPVGGRAAYFVPLSVLRPLSELSGVLKPYLEKRVA